MICGQARALGAVFQRESNGAPRGLGRIFDTQVWQVYRHLPDPHFFISVANDKQADAVELFRKRYGDDRVFIEKVEQPTLPEPEGAMGRLQMATPYDVSAPAQSILRQLWAYKRVWEFAREQTGLVGFELFVRIRPDLFMRNFSPPAHWPATNEAFTCFWGHYGGVNDRLAVMGATAARAWFGALDALPALLERGCPLHPESIQLGALDAAGCRNYPILTALFFGIRANGDTVPPDFHPEIDPFIHQKALIEYAYRY